VGRLLTPALLDACEPVFSLAWEPAGTDAAFSLTPAVKLVTASRICSSSARLRENAVLGSASATGVNSVPKTAHVAFCGKGDRATSVTGASEAGGSLPFCLASPIAAHHSAAFASMALGAM
jgi:hypothetical protein